MQHCPLKKFSASYPLGARLAGRRETVRAIPAGSTWGAPERWIPGACARFARTVRMKNGQKPVSIAPQGPT